jgi:hypothetical protein
MRSHTLDVRVSQLSCIDRLNFSLDFGTARSAQTSRSLRGWCALAESITLLAQSRGFNQEQFELQLSLVEILLDVADRRGTQGALRRARSAFEVASRHFVPALSAQERELYAERLASLSERLNSAAVSSEERIEDAGVEEQMASDCEDLAQMLPQGSEDFREGDRLRQDLAE